MGNRNGWALQIALSGLLCEVGTDVLCVGVFPLRHLVPRRTDIYAFESKPDPVFVAQKFSIRHWSPQTEAASPVVADPARSAEWTSELQSLRHLVCRLLLEKIT